MSQTIEVGDVVTLISGSSLMTVAEKYVKDDGVLYDCRWFGPDLDLEWAQLYGSSLEKEEIEQKEEHLVPGDVVQLKSGGRKMTLGHIAIKNNRKIAHCDWLERWSFHDEIKSKDFDLNMLTRYDVNKTTSKQGETDNGKASVQGETDNGKETPKTQQAD